MATSATYTAACSAVGSFSYASNFTLYVKLEETDVSTSANTSKVKYTVYCQSSGSGSISAKHLKKFIINGSTIINETVSVSASSPNAYIAIASGTTGAIAHNSDGTKSISFEAQIKASSYGVSASKSGTFTLTSIPRYATSVQSLNTKTSSSIKMNWSSNSTIDYIWYSTNNGSSWTAVGSVNATSGNYTISGLSANTTYNIKTRVRRKDSQLTTDSSVLAVTTYAKTTPTISLSSKTVNSITVTSGCNVTVSSTQYRIKTSSGSYGSYQTSATFTGLSPNTAYVIEVYKVGSDSGESGTATLSVTTYDIARITASNFTHGNNLTCTITNPGNTTISVAVYKNDINQGAIAAYRTVSGTSYTFNFTDGELDTLYKYYGTSNTATVKVYIASMSNNTQYWDYKSITVTLTGNQKTGRLNVNGTWKRTKRWINVNGTWKRCVRWINVNGTWKRSI